MPTTDLKAAGHTGSSAMSTMPAIRWHRGAPVHRRQIPKVEASSTRVAPVACGHWIGMCCSSTSWGRWQHAAYLYLPLIHVAVTLGTPITPWIPSKLRYASLRNSENSTLPPSSCEVFVGQGLSEKMNFEVTSPTSRKAGRKCDVAAIVPPNHYRQITRLSAVCRGLADK